MSGYGEIATDSFELKRFMIQEAHEKAFEIKVTCQRMFEKEKANIVKTGKKKVDDNILKSRIDLTTELNIKRSTQVNKSRMKKMNERDKLLKQLVKEALVKIEENLAQPENEEYREVLKKLIMQGLIKLLEKKVLIKCREKDVDLINGIIEEVKEEFIELMQKETGSDEYTVEIEVIEDNFIKENTAAGKCGGLVMCSTDKLIVCSNTLNERLALCYEESLPILRKKLFPNN